MIVPERVTCLTEPGRLFFPRYLLHVFLEGRPGSKLLHPIEVPVIHVTATTILRSMPNSNDPGVKILTFVALRV